jgi:hypothetical protein
MIPERILVMFLAPVVVTSLWQAVLLLETLGAPVKRSSLIK